jgi:hypothetical protein
LLPEEKLKKEVATQKRISKYFHDMVMPKLAKCWDPLKGPGSVTFDYDFVRRGTEWIFEKTILFHSTIPDDQNGAALKCMREAVKGTSFKADGAAETPKQKRFLVSWSWPVPFPPDSEEQYKTMMMSIGGGGYYGCDGHGAPPKCKACNYNAGSPSASCCVTVCVGYTSCGYSVIGGRVVGCYNDPPTACASGGPFGVSGGMIMY